MSEPICVGPGIGGKRPCPQCGEPLNETVEVHHCLGSREAVEEARQAEMRDWMAKRGSAEPVAPPREIFTARQTLEFEPCGYCGEGAKVFFSFNPEATPDICAACFVTACGFAEPDAKAFSVARASQGDPPPPELEREVVSLRQTVTNFEAGWADQHRRNVEVNAELKRLRGVPAEGPPPPTQVLYVRQPDGRYTVATGAECPMCDLMRRRLTTSELARVGLINALENARRVPAPQGDAAPPGPWMHAQNPQSHLWAVMHDSEDVATVWPLRTETEAIAVRDALNRVAGGGASSSGSAPPDEPIRGLGAAAGDLAP